MPHDIGPIGKDGLIQIELYLSTYKGKKDPESNN